MDTLSDRYHFVGIPKYRMLPEFVWDAGVPEGNPFTFPEVKTLLEGVTVGGRKLSDQEQILNLAEAAKWLLALVKAHRFEAPKAVSRTSIGSSCATRPWSGVCFGARGRRPITRPLSPWTNTDAIRRFPLGPGP